ncbi:hypothetical protein [Hymenobacter sp. IS2118]|uniref:hypothetical protein n=1 Tax=Hymenobacter sp. IS2118 TaxID=1505605 RepID=UPI000ACC1BAF|nr:hypothetical protein [Hymenobacter sp. IS2118]
MAALPLRAQTNRKPAPKPAPRPAPSAPQSGPSLLETVLPTTFSGGPFAVGNQVLNLGMGVGSSGSYGADQVGGNPSISPALNLSYERGLFVIGPGVLGAGVLGGYQSATRDLGSGGKLKYNDFLLALRGAFHYPVLPELDAYAGLSVGLRYTKAAYEGSAPAPEAGSNARLTPGIFVGGRYFLLENLGVFTELGYDQTYLKIGFTGRF